MIVDSADTVNDRQATRQGLRRDLMEDAPGAVSVIEDAKVVFCNSHLLDMLGYSPEEMIGKEIARIIHGDDLGWVMERYAAHAEGMPIPKTIHRDVKSNGDVIWVESIGTLIEWEGRPAVLYFTSDVTDRQHAEESLRQSEEKYRMSENKYRNLIDLAPEAIWVVENQKLIFFNNHALEMLGYSQKEMMGIPLRKIIHDEDWEKALERHKARADGTLFPKTVCRHVTKRGDVLWVECVGQRILWEERPAVLYFSSDITQRKRLEEELAQSQKMEAVGRLAGGIAHDFNNMVQVILGYCSMMKSYPEDRNAILKDLLVMEESGRRAASLTQQLLAFSRKQIVQPRIIDLGELVQVSEKMLSRVLREDIGVTVVLGDEACCVRADAAQVQQIIMNLALNARDAMPHGGRIVISIDSVARREAMEDDIPSGDYVRLAVSDTGHGMDAGTLDHVFEPFFTTKGPGKGTGLGLSIVYGIVKQYKGHIRVSSMVGEGSRFTIYLPRVFEPTADSKAQERESQRGSGSILLVEDNGSVRGLVRKMLEKAGYTVTEAKSGEEAITVCRGRDDGFDLLLSDIVLTGMGGEQVAGSVSRIFPGIRVLYMSGYAEKGGVPQREEHPLILLKPFSACELLAQVKRILCPGGFPSPTPNETPASG